MIALGAAASLSAVMPGGTVFALYLVVLELLATYLIHCPAHYLVGTALGIRFRSIQFGRTTLAKVVTPRIARLARVLPILTLSVEKPSLARASKRSASAMFASGVVASICAAWAVAVASTWLESALYASLNWVVAFAFLAFDAAFSPRSGDIMRAKQAMNS